MFDCFSRIDSIELVERIAFEVLEDFQSDGVIYAELRTTPRPLPDGTTKLDYMVGTRLLNIE